MSTRCSRVKVNYVAPLEFDWLTPKKPGRYTLMARAKDAKGRVQPDKHNQNYGSYVIDHLLPIEVFVVAAKQLDEIPSEQSATISSRKI